MPLFHLHDPSVHAQKKQFEWGAHLGSGTFGEVSRCHWKAHDPPLDVAVKVIPKSLVASKDDQVHIMNMMKELHHPHIINLVDWFQSREHYYILFELAEGGELFDRLMDAGQFDEGPTAVMIRDITKGISYIHGHHVVHRDLKPENFLLRGKHAEPPFDVIVADFGVAHEMGDPQEVMRNVAGSPGYTAPEVYAKKGYGKAVDMWSLGVIAFVCLAGRFPFKNLDGPAFLAEVDKEVDIGGVYFPKDPWDKVSESAKDFIRRCLTKDLKRRMTVDQALKHPWLSEAPENPNAVTPVPIKPILPGKNRGTPPMSGTSTPSRDQSDNHPHHHHQGHLAALFSHLSTSSPKSSNKSSRDRTPPSGLADVGSQKSNGPAEVGGAPEEKNSSAKTAGGSDSVSAPERGREGEEKGKPKEAAVDPTPAPSSGGAGESTAEQESSLRRVATQCEAGRRTGV